MPKGKQKESPVKLVSRLVTTVPHGIMGQALIVTALAEFANKAATAEDGSQLVASSVYRDVGEFLGRELTAWHNFGSKAGTDG